MTSLTCIFTATDSPYLAEKCTGLGNVLFQIAAIYALAKETGRTAEYTNLNTLCEKLETLTGCDYKKTIFRNISPESNFNYTKFAYVQTDYRNSNFKQELVNYVNNTHENICLQGHFESHHYFSNYKDEIISMLSPDQNSLDFITTKYPMLLNSSKSVGAIHIRKHHPSFNDDAVYIQRAIDYLPADVTYIVISNDIEAAKKELEPIDRDFIFASNNFDFIDVWIMSLCKYNIMSHSTMSWWGSFLNLHEDKVVIYPQTRENIYPGPISNFYLKTYIPL
jgi:hypothetical protein